MTTRIVLGGGTGSSHHFGPGEFAPGYSTVTNGNAAPIACRAGEVIACIAPGSVYQFSTWVAGTLEDVVAELRRAGRNELAETIAKEAEDMPSTAAAQLAAALGTRPECVVEALRALRLELREVREDAAQELKEHRSSPREHKRRKPQQEMRPRRPYRTSWWRAART
jgi:hypothetical protein